MAFESGHEKLGGRQKIMSLLFYPIQAMHYLLL